MNIREIRPGDDRFAVSHIYEESWKFAYRDILPQDYLVSIPSGRWVKHLDHEGFYHLLLLDGCIPVGTSSYCASRSPELAGYGEIVSLYLLPTYMGMGYGRRLLSAAIDGLKALGYRDVFLWVLEENHHARRFYERMGFVQSGAALDAVIGGKTVRELQYHMRGI